MSAASLFLVVFGALGFLAIGSFTCVIIDRLPLKLDEPNRFGELWDTRPWSQVLGGRSRCSTCGEPVRSIDNIPVLSWLLLRGKCRGCGDRIPGFHPAVELAAPLLFLASIWALGTTDWRLVVLLWFIPVALAVAVIDFRTLIVPTRIVWPALGVSVVLAVAAAGLEGNWIWLRSAAIGLAVMAGPLFIIWFIYPKGMGFGDVRLATFVGFNVGFFASQNSISGPVILTVIAMGIAAVLGVVIGIVALGARGRKAQVPFGPSMLAAGFICMVLAERI